MISNNVVKGDYKKWLLYSFEKQDFNDHYNLFKALKEGRNFGSIFVSTNDSVSGVTYTLNHENIQTGLEINDNQRVLFKEYLIDLYFKTENVEELFLQRTQQLEKAKNHHFIDKKPDFSSEEKEFKIKVHPKESTYFSIKVFVSILFYVGILVGLAYYASRDLSYLVGLSAFIPLFLVLWIFGKLLKGIFIGMIKGNSIEVTEDQFPEIYSIVKEQAAKLKIAKIPDIHIAQGDFNAFVTRFSRSNILMIYSAVIETTLSGNYDVLKYVTAHELCHIKRKHLTKEIYLFPSKLIPFLGLAYSRGREYTCDRVGYSLSPKGSIEGILIMTTGKEIHSKFNVDLHIRNSVENSGFWIWISEKFLTHPHLFKRLVEIKKYSKYN